MACIETEFPFLIQSSSPDNQERYQFSITVINHFFFYFQRFFLNFSD